MILFCIVSLGSEPWNFTIEYISKLTDFQIVFVHFLPKVIKEFESAKEMHEDIKKIKGKYSG